MLDFSPSAVVYHLFAGAALPISSGRGVGVFWRVLMPTNAMRLSEIGAHGKSFVEHTTLWVKKLVERFAVLSANNNRVRFHAGNLGENCRLVLDTFYGYFPCVPAVKALLSARCPPAVFRGIGSVVVDTIKRSAIRARPDVLHEGREAFAPSLAHGNASSAVGRVVLEILVVTAALDAAPHGVQRMLVFEWHDVIITNAVKNVKESSSAFQRQR